MTPRGAGTRRVLVTLGTALLLAALDVSLKRAIQAELSTPAAGAGPACEANEAGRTWPRRVASRTVDIGVARIRYVENCGAAFGLLDGRPPWVRIAVFGSAALLLGLWVLRRRWRGEGARSFAVGSSMCCGGALGNLVDRAQLGYVIDFLALGPGTINLADAFVVVGLALCIAPGKRVRR